MKHLIMLLSITALSLVACEKQESKNFLKDIEGKWELEQIVYGHDQNDPVSTLNFDETFLEIFSCDISDNLVGSDNCKAVLDIKGKKLDLTYQITYTTEGTNRLRIYETAGIPLTEEGQQVVGQLKNLSTINLLDKKTVLHWESNNPVSSEFPSMVILKM